MTHPEIIKLEEMVRRLSEAMDDLDRQPPAEIVGLAREYAEACEVVNDRLKVCFDILTKGIDHEHQALMAATRQPDLLDSCGVLAELQTEEYESYCQDHHLPQAPSLNERAKQAVDPLYGKAGAFQKRLRMEFSAANSKRDFREALEIARQLAKSDPAAERQATALEDRLVKEVLENKIGPALDKGDEEGAVLALEEIEAIAPGRKPRPDDRREKVWVEAIESRESLEREAAIRESANLLPQVEAAREADKLDLVVELLARIDSSMEKHGFSLSSDKEALFKELQEWKDTEVRKAKKEKDFQTALRELRTLLKKISDKELQSSLPTYEENREDALKLQRLWREIADFKKTVPEELQTSARKTLGEVSEKINRHKAGKRRNLIALTAVSAVVVTVLSILTAMWIKAGDMAGRVMAAVDDGRARDLENLLGKLDEAPPLWATFASLPRAASNGKAWLKSQREDAARLKGILSTLRSDLQGNGSDWTPEALSVIKGQLDETEADISKVNRDDRTLLVDTITSLKMEWGKITGNRRKEIVTTFHDQVKELDIRIERDLDYSRPNEALMESTSQIGAKITDMNVLAKVELEELRPRESDLAVFDSLCERFGKFEKEIEKVRDIMADCGGASQLQAYIETLKPLRETDFLEGAQKMALGNLIGAADSQEKIFRDILMPDNPLLWLKLTQREFSPDGRPPDITEDEELLFLSLRDDESLTDMYRYTITEGGESRTIYVRGATMERGSEQSVGKVAEGMKASEVYDPAGSSLTSVKFKEEIYIRTRSSGGRVQGALPENEMLTAESTLFQSFNIGSFVNDDFTSFQRSFLDLADEIIDAPDETNPLFRAYVFLEAGKLMNLRKEKWLINFSDFEKDFEELQTIAGYTRSYDWCSAVKTAKVSEPINEFFQSRRGRVSYLSEAKALYGFYSRVHSGGLVFCGHLDHTNSMQLNQPVASTNQLWGLDSELKVAILFERPDQGDWIEKSPAAPFSPLFLLRIDPELIWESIAGQHEVDPTDPRLRNKLPAALGFQSTKE